MNNNIDRSLRTKAFAALAGLGFLVLCVAAWSPDIQPHPSTSSIPTGPKPMPNKWKIGGVTGLAVDKDDNVWVLDRPNDLRGMELKAEDRSHGRLLHPPSLDDPH